MGKIQKFHKKIKNYTVTECQNYRREEAAIVVTMHYHTHREMHGESRANGNATRTYH